MTKRSRTLRVVHRYVEPCSFVEFLSSLSARILIRQGAELSRRRGGRMIVLANDPVGIEINARGFFEDLDLSAIFAFLAPLAETFRHGIALDIGANIGSHSIFFSSRFAEVFAFEPHPLMFRVLEINASLYAKIRAHPFGLSDHAGMAVLTENPCSSGMNSLDLKGGPGLNVALKRLDDLGLDAGRIALIKLDVEGHEAHVLRGGLATLSAAKPIVLFEMLQTESPDNAEKVEILRGLGYRFAWPVPVRPGLGTYLRVLRMVATRQRWKHIVSGGVIERANHSMVIAIPPQWQALLEV